MDTISGKGELGAMASIFCTPDYRVACTPDTPSLSAVCPHVYSFGAGLRRWVSVWIAFDGHHISVTLIGRLCLQRAGEYAYEALKLCRRLLNLPTSARPPVENAVWNPRFTQGIVCSLVRIKGIRLVRQEFDCDFA